MARYDIIAGKIADDATNATLTAYLAGAFGTAGDQEADDFCIKQLLPNKLKDQYCFKTEAAIECLKFVNRRRDGQGQKRGIDRFSMFKDRKSTV